MLLLGESLYENTSCASAWSHCFGWLLIKLHSRFPRLVLLTYVCPSVCRWYVELKIKFTPIFFHKVLQKCPTNLVSLSKTILLSSTCNFITSLKNRFATCVASLVLNQGMKCPMFENISTTIKIESWPLWVLGNPKTKSILTTSHG